MLLDYAPKIYVHDNLVLLLDYALKYDMFTTIWCCYWTMPLKYDMFTII